MLNSNLIVDRSHRTEKLIVHFCFNVDFGRAYLSNACVARELHCNGVGYILNEKSKGVAREWGKKCFGQTHHTLKIGLKKEEL